MMLCPLYSLSLCILAIAAGTRSAYAQEFVNSLITDRHLYEGDIVLTPEQREDMEATANPNDVDSPQRAVLRHPRTLWRNGQIPYLLDGSLGASAKKAINEAIEEYRDQTCIRFVPKTRESDYVVFYRGTGCHSSIGRVGGAQYISIGWGCDHKGTVMHEMFHSLGRWHEHSRPDRNRHVKINGPNIRSGVESNFYSVSSAFVTTQGVPYDYDSIMHYGAYAFSRNSRPTITPLVKDFPLRRLGQRERLSTRDVEHIHTLYCKSATEVASWSSWGSWSACSKSCNGGMRSRVRSCTGGSSCQGSNINSEHCNTEPCAVPVEWGSWTSWSACSVTCGGGRQTRLRSCLHGNTCHGQNMQFRDCETADCPDPEQSPASGSGASGGEVSRSGTSGGGASRSGTSGDGASRGVAWSEWSQCTRSCGGGTRFRTRCQGTECEKELEECHTEECVNRGPDLTGLRHIDCYYVPKFSGSLGLIEGQVEDVSDVPSSRRQPVRKCGQAATKLGYSLFAVSVNYCISGSNTVTDYRYVRAGLCKDGVGGYSRGYFFMDVYRITDPEAFREVSSDPEAANLTSLPDSDVPHSMPSLTIEQVAENSAVLFSSSIAILVCAVTIVAFLSYNILLL